jgi:hypothetical protein
MKTYVVPKPNNHQRCILPRKSIGNVGYLVLVIHIKIAISTLTVICFHELNSTGDGYLVVAWPILLMAAFKVPQGLKVM